MMKQTMPLTKVVLVVFGQRFLLGEIQIKMVFRILLKENKTNVF